VIVMTMADRLLSDAQLATLVGSLEQMAAQVRHRSGMAPGETVEAALPLEVGYQLCDARRRRLAGSGIVVGPPVRGVEFCSQSVPFLLYPLGSWVCEPRPSLL
jgi:hypothetical protein